MPSQIAMYVASALAIKSFIWNSNFFTRLEQQTFKSIGDCTGIELKMAATTNIEFS